MKESFYFPHDNNAHNDPKLMGLLMGMGLASIGLYWIIIEIMHQQEDGIINEEEFKNYIQFYSMKENSTYVEDVFNKFQTLEIFCFEDGKVFSKRVLKNKEFRSNLKEKRSFAGKMSAEKRALKRQEGTNVQQNSTSVEQDFNNEKKKKRKEKEIKVNNKEITIIKKQVFNENDFEYIISKKFLQEQINNKNTSTLYLYKENGDELIQKWSDVVRKLKNLDKIPQEIIEKVFDFTTRDEFWKEQFGSLEKFRKKNNEKVPYFMVLANKAKIEIKKEQKIETLVKSGVNEAF